jgi:hypothetical protein
MRDDWRGKREMVEEGSERDWRREREGWKKERLEAVKGEEHKSISENFKTSAPNPPHLRVNADRKSFQTY